MLTVTCAKANRPGPRRVSDAVVAELKRTLTAHRQAPLVKMTARDGGWFDAEMDKLGRWAEDCREVRAVVVVVP